MDPTTRAALYRIEEKLDRLLAQKRGPVAYFVTDEGVVDVTTRLYITGEFEGQPFRGEFRLNG
jgi:hypothetical protein